MAERKRKILIVDDDPDILAAIGAVLEARNYEIVTARDGEEAFSFQPSAISSPSHPDSR